MKKSARHARSLFSGPKHGFPKLERIDLIMKTLRLPIPLSQLSSRHLLSYLFLLVCLAYSFSAVAQSGQLGAGNAASSAAQAVHKVPPVRIAVVPLNEHLQELGTEGLAGGVAPSPGPIGEAVLNSGGIEYHNAPSIMVSPTVYLIWYGNWSGNSATTILPQFVSDLNHTKYFNTNTTYGWEWTDGNGSGQILTEGTTTNAISFGGQIFDSYSQGTSLSLTAMQAVVNRALSNGLPTNGGGIYLVLTSSDVTATSGSQSFCNNFCGYHSIATLHSTSIQFGFIGNPARCISSCAASFIGLGPNGNAGADGMANVMAHEINETLTDPDLTTGWYHLSGTGEVGDLCNFNFGSTFGTAPNGAPYNVTFNGRHYLIQQNWLNLNGGGCSLAYSTPNGTPAVGKVAVIGSATCGDFCDSGTIQMQLIMPSRTVTETIVYDGSGVNGPNDALGVANALASAFNNDPNANTLVSAAVALGNPYWAPTGNTVYWITFTTKQNGSSLNGNQWSITTSSFSGGPGPFTLTPTVASMTGGADSCCTN
jgi:hypothetical protein